MKSIEEIMPWLLSYEWEAVLFQKYLKVYVGVNEPRRFGGIITLEQAKRLESWGLIQITSPRVWLGASWMSKRKNEKKNAKARLTPKGFEVRQLLQMVDELAEENVFRSYE